MPRLKPDTQRARRENILDAAELCFARTGFHRTTMQDICKQAGVSPGALYIYFTSKEALIAGLAERDRAKLAEELRQVAEAPDLIAALGQLGEHYTVEQPSHKRQLCIEIGLESTRNPQVGAIYRTVDDACMQGFATLFERAAADGRIAPATDIATITAVLAVIGDGIFFRRAVDPQFDPKTIMPVFLQLLTQLLRPTTGAQPQSHDNGKDHP